MSKKYSQEELDEIILSGKHLGNGVVLHKAVVIDLNDYYTGSNNSSFMNEDSNHSPKTLISTLTQLPKKQTTGPKSYDEWCNTTGSWGNIEEFHADHDMHFVLKENNCTGNTDHTDSDNE